MIMCEMKMAVRKMKMAIRYLLTYLVGGIALVLRK